MYAVKVTGEVENADVALFFKDGSYIVSDFENDTGEAVVYYNTNAENDFEDGLTIFLNSNGLPKMISFKENNIIINTKGENLDLAFIDSDGGLSYAFNVNIESELTRSLIATKAWYNLITDPFVDAWNAAKSFDWSWDEHQAKAIVPFLCKVASFGITAASLFAEGPFGAISLAVTLGDEIYKSKNGYDAPWGEYFTATEAALVGPSGMKWGTFIKDGKLVFSKKWLPLSMLASVLNQYGDEQLKKMGEYIPMVEQTFGQEWQIRLSSYTVEAGPEGGQFTVSVDTKTGWSIDDSNVDKRWCDVQKQGNTISVKVSPYTEGVEVPTCYALVKCPPGYEDRIPPARLTIKQTGVVFELSASSLSFNQFASNGAVSVSFNNRISSWEVTSYPEWCNARPYPDGPLSKALLVVVDDEMSLLDNLEGTVTATAYVPNSAPINRYLYISRIPLVWDKTAWSFEPKLNVKTSGDAGYGGGLDKITINISDVANGSFTSNFGWNSMSMDSTGKLTFQYKGTATRSWTDEEGKKHSATMNESATLHLTRIDETHAHAFVSGQGSCSGDLSGSVSVSGQCDGTRIGYTKSSDIIDNTNIIRIK